MSTIQKLIKEIKTLKPIPQIAHQLMEIVEDPQSSMSDIADVILYDPMITANLLRVCNSAYFALPRKIESVREAITMMGLEKIIDIAILKCSPERMKNSFEGYGLNEGDLWRHSVYSALIAKELAEKKEVKNKYLIFTASLLKDIGKIILDRFIVDAFRKINVLVQLKGYSFKEAEKKIIGIDHAELGGLVAKKWNFSAKMIYIIQNHHLSEESAQKDTETNIVYLADTLCMIMGIGIGSDALAYRFHDNVLEELKVSLNDFQKLIAGFGANMRKVEALLNFI
ncbi:MAG: HDOD domain-containing protein [Desulfobacterales bacterium]|nr:HDOD domain-containing protein [Desulfobacterales bacterium]